MIIIYTTLPSLKAAKQMARVLVQHKLVACVNLIPKIHSVYSWDKKINESSETLLYLKTTPRLKKQVLEWMQKNHPYKVPALFCFKAREVNKEYKKWAFSVCKKK